MNEEMYKPGVSRSERWVYNPAWFRRLTAWQASGGKGGVPGGAAPLGC
jgi:hypothetical protein